MLKKKYFSPELNRIVFEVEDIITHSLATSEGDNDLDFDDFFGFDGVNIYYNGEKVGK